MRAAALPAAYEQRAWLGLSRADVTWLRLRTTLRLVRIGMVGVALMSSHAIAPEIARIVRRTLNRYSG